MAENGDKAPPPRKKKKHDHPAHGGAWKVAFADFMTSMFALFLVLWIISSTSAEQKEAIAQYFQNPTIFKSGSSSPMNMGGEAAVKNKQEGGSDMTQDEGEEQQKALEALDSALATDSTLASLGNQFKTRMTDKGLEIEISDAAGLGTFELGSAAINPQMHQALAELGSSLGSLDNQIVISGHTDAYEYTNGYSNWQLSADRANSVRQYLADKGVDPKRVNSVIGSGDRELKNPENPYAPENRRVTLLVLKKGESLTPQTLSPESGTGESRKGGKSSSSGFRPLGETVEHPAPEPAHH